MDGNEWAMIQLELKYCERCGGLFLRRQSRHRRVLLELRRARFGRYGRCENRDSRPRAAGEAMLAAQTNAMARTQYERSAVPNELAWRCEERMSTNLIEIFGTEQSGEGSEAPLLKRWQQENRRRAAGFRSDPDLWLYRDRTAAMLRRYFRCSIEVGRLPSLLGREFFRTRVTCYRVGTFEDAVIFVHDVERCLEKLRRFRKGLCSGKVVLEDFTHDEAARLMGCWRRTVGRRLPEALDHLSDIFLTKGTFDAFAGEAAREEKKLVKRQKWMKWS